MEKQKFWISGVAVHQRAKARAVEALVERRRSAPQRHVAQGFEFVGARREVPVGADLPEGGRRDAEEAGMKMSKPGETRRELVARDAAPSLGEAGSIEILEHEEHALARDSGVQGRRHARRSSAPGRVGAVERTLDFVRAELAPV